MHHLENEEQQRHANMESLYDYGSRAGFWRLHNLLTRKEIPCTVFAVGMALQRNPDVCEAMKQTSNWEIASHGYRWWDYQNVNEDMEREHIQRTVEIHKELIGRRPVVSLTLSFMIDVRTIDLHLPYTMSIIGNVSG